MAIILGLDIGTSKLAGIAFDSYEKKMVAVITVPNTATIAKLPRNRHEQNAEFIYRLCLKLLESLIASGKFSLNEVATIAIAGQMHGVLLLDRKLNPLTPLITWCDQRTAVLTTEIGHWDWPINRTGCYLNPGYGGATLAALARTGDVPAGALALTVADYVAAKLCGQAAIDPTHAASWGIMNIQQLTWDSELRERLAIPAELLPPIRPCLSELGKLQVDLGLPSTVSVRLPLGDNQSSFIGTCGLKNNTILLNLGTGGQLSLPCPEFRLSPDMETRPLPFGGFLLVGASLCGGRAYSYLKDFFARTIKEFTARTMTDDDIYDIMNQMAANVDTELKVDTRLTGSRIESERRGSITALTPDNFTPEALTRSFIRGMVQELTDMVDQQTALAFRQVMVSGNAVRKNSLVRQFISEELGLPCVMAENNEEAAIGVALAAAHAIDNEM